MARIRSVHPGFFSDEDWLSVSPLARLFAIGIWTECDDQGAFAWKPVQLKIRLMPADNVDIRELLAELEGAGLVRRYEHEGHQYGVVRNFVRYQKPKYPKATNFIPPDLRNFVGLTADMVADEPAELTPEDATINPDSRNGASPTDAIGEIDDDEHAPFPQREGVDGEMTPLTRTLGVEGRGEEGRRGVGKSAHADPPPAEKPSRRKPELPLPADWKPNPAGIQAARERGMTDATISEQAQRMRNWAAQEDKRRRDWDAQWRNWVLGWKGDQAKAPPSPAGGTIYPAKWAGLDEALEAMPPRRRADALIQLDRMMESASIADIDAYVASLIHPDAPATGAGCATGGVVAKLPTTGGNRKNQTVNQPTVSPAPGAEPAPFDELDLAL